MKKVKLPDLYFLIAINDKDLQTDKVPKELHDVCRQIPSFMFKKNISSYT